MFNNVFSQAMGPPGPPGLTGPPGVSTIKIRTIHLAEHEVKIIITASANYFVAIKTFESLLYKDDNCIFLLFQ